MDFKFFENFEPVVKEPSYIEYWYDRYSRSWVVQLKDENGYQIGNADYPVTLKGAKIQIKRWQEEYKLEKVIKTKPSGR